MRGGRILYVDTGKAFGGAERVTLSLAGAFSASGADVLCVVDPGAASFRNSLLDAGVRVSAVAEASSRSLAAPLEEEVRRFRPDWVHIHRTWPLSDRHAAAAAKRGGAGRIIATEHVRSEGCGLRDRLAKRLLVRHDDRIVAVSDAVRRSLIRYWRVPAKRITVIPNGIDTARFRGALPLEPDPFPPGTTHRIGSIGRLERQKGFDVLLEAMTRIRAALPGAVLVIAGEGSRRADLEERAAGLGLGGAALFPGAIPDAAPFLARLDLFVLPSRWEGLPLTILEAMAAGTPIAATAVDGTAEAARDGREASLVPPEDPERLAAACVDALRDRAGALRRAEAARIRVEERHSLAGMVDRYREAYGW
ncbi:MAG: glycosyltransferase [Candidatus Eisenbacteria bacterium]|nr:glycosyltransferase [Candidatus Eisenbacteria bacterium]